MGSPHRYIKLTSDFLAWYLLWQFELCILRSIKKSCSINPYQWVYGCVIYLFLLDSDMRWNDSSFFINEIRIHNLTARDWARAIILARTNSWTMSTRKILSICSNWAINIYNQLFIVVFRLFVVDSTYIDIVPTTIVRTLILNDCIFLMAIRSRRWFYSINSNRGSLSLIDVSVSTCYFHCITDSGLLNQHEDILKRQKGFYKEDLSPL